MWRHVEVWGAIPSRSPAEIATEVPPWYACVMMFEGVVVRDSRAKSVPCVSTWCIICDFCQCRAECPDETTSYKYMSHLLLARALYLEIPNGSNSPEVFDSSTMPIGPFWDREDIRTADFWSNFWAVPAVLKQTSKKLPQNAFRLEISTWRQPQWSSGATSSSNPHLPKPSQKVLHKISLWWMLLFSVWSFAIWCRGFSAGGPLLSLHPMPEEMAQSWQAPRWPQAEPSGLSPDLMQSRRPGLFYDVGLSNPGVENWTASLVRGLNICKMQARDKENANMGRFSVGISLAQYDVAISTFWTWSHF